MYKESINVILISPIQVEPWMFRSMNIEQCRQNRKFENENVQWNRVSTIANLNFQFEKWCDNLVKDDTAIQNILKQNKINYSFDGFVKLLLCFFFFFVFSLCKDIWFLTCFFDCQAKEFVQQEQQAASAKYYPKYR